MRKRQLREKGSTESDRKIEKGSVESHRYREKVNVRKRHISRQSECEKVTDNERRVKRKKVREVVRKFWVSLLKIFNCIF